MNTQKTIATLEVNEDDTVILRERIAIIENEVEQHHWFEQRTIRAGDDYSQEPEKVQRVCDAVFGD